MSRYCTKCGAEMPEDARFCGSCGRPAHQTAAVATPEADVSVPPPGSRAEVTPPSGAGQTSGATFGPRLGLAAVFLLLLIAGTARALPSATPGETLAFQLGESLVPAVMDAITLLAVLLFFAGIVYVTGRKNGTTFPEAIYSWSMVILAGILAFLIVVA
jgi:zinc-ribbon domain